MSLAAVLAQHGISVDTARQFLLQNLDHPDTIYNVAQQFQLTTPALAELAGVGHEDVNNYLNANGLSPTTLDAGGTATTDYVLLSDLRDGDIFLYNPVTATGKKLFSFGEGITDIATAANGDIYATDFNTIYRYEFATGTLSDIGTHGGAINSLATYGGLLVGASFTNSEITVFDPVNGSKITSFTLPGGPAAGDIAFTGGALYRTTIGEGLYRTDVATGESTQVAGSLAGDYFGLAVAPDGELVGFSGEGNVRVFNPADSSVHALADVELVGLDTVSGAAEVQQNHLLAFL